MRPLTRKEPIIKRALSTKTPKILKAINPLDAPAEDQILAYLSQFVSDGIVTVGTINKKRADDDIEGCVDSIAL